MEPFILIPTIIVMSAVAIVMALSGHSLPPAASSAFLPAPVGPSIKRTPATQSRSTTPKDVVMTLMPAETREADVPIEEINNMTDSNFSQTDVLLADALTEMIGLKTELYFLRSKVDNLNVEVARLAGGGPRRTPPSAAKRPIQLRKAA